MKNELNELKETETKEEVRESEQNESITINPVKIKVKYDFRTFKYALTYITNYKRKAKLISYIFCAILAGAGVAMYFMYKDIMWPVIILLFMGYLLYSSLTSDSKIDKQIGTYFNQRPVFEQVVTLTDESIKIEKGDGGEAATYDWAYVSEIHQLPEFYMLFIGRNGMPVMIDRNPELVLEGTEVDLDVIIAQKKALKPFKSVNKNIITKPITYVHKYVAPVETEVTEEELNKIDSIEEVIVEKEESVITPLVVEEEVKVEEKEVVLETEEKEVVLEKEETADETIVAPKEEKPVAKKPTTAKKTTTGAKKATTAKKTTTGAKKATTAKKTTTGAKKATTAKKTTTGAKKTTTAKKSTTGAKKTTTAKKSTTGAKKTTTGKKTTTAAKKTTTSKKPTTAAKKTTTSTAE